MKVYRYITLLEVPELRDTAAEWFHKKWGCRKRHTWNAWRHI